MDYGKSFSFVFEDKEWLRKIAMGSLVLFGSFLLIIPGIFFIVGYQVAVGRNVAQGREFPLPDTDEFGEVFRHGATAFGITFVYSLPLMIVFCVTFGLIGAAGGLAEGDAEALSAALGVFGMLFYCIYMILAIGVGFLMQAALVQYVREGTFASGMRFGEVWALLRDNIADILLTMLCVLAAGIVGQIVLGVSAITLCGPLVLLFPMFLWQTSVGGHLLGQLAANSGGKSGNKEEYYDSLI